MIVTKQTRMENVILSILFLAGLTSSTGVGKPSLEQTLPSITTARKNPTLKCIMRGSKVSHHVLSWYRQKPDNDIEFLVSHRIKSRPTYGEGIAERFIPEVDDSSNTFTLTIGNTEKKDEGLYYCAVWFSNHYIFSEGTEVIVQEDQKIQPPVMMLFEPSFLEIQNHHTATFLCLVQSYFPKPLRIKWFLSNKPLPPEFFTFQDIQNTDDSFCQTSSVTIPLRLWRKGEEVTCLLQHESGVQTRSIISTGMYDIFWEECEAPILVTEDLSLAKNETDEQNAAVIYRDSVKVLHVAFVTYSGLLSVSVSYGLLMSILLIKRNLYKSKDMEETIGNDRPIA